MNEYGRGDRVRSIPGFRLADARAELAALWEAVAELRDELHELDKAAHRRIDDVHERALRELTRLHEKGQTHAD